MVGYVKPGTEPCIGLLTDYTSPELTDLLRKLGQTHTNLTVKNTKCGYGCSDHASLTKAGYPTAMPFESLFNDINPYIHSGDDTVEHIDFDHALQFAKLALAYVVELSSSA